MRKVLRRLSLLVVLVTLLSIAPVAPHATASSVTAPPPNDDFPGMSISSVPTRLTGSTVDSTWQLDVGEWIESCVQAVVPGQRVFPVSSGGAAHDPQKQTVWYTVRLPADARVSISVRATSTPFDPVVAVYTGDTLDGLSIVACNNDEPGNRPHARVSFDAAANTDYRVQIHGALGRGSTFGEYVVQFALDNGPACVINRIGTVPFSSTSTEVVVNQAGCATYQFWVGLPNGEWWMGRDWGPVHYWTWDATGWPTGDYTIAVLARSPGSSAEYDYVAWTPFSLQRRRLIP